MAGRPSPLHDRRRDAEDDVGEVVSWCSDCNAQRRFVREARDFAAMEEAQAAPNVGRALLGEGGYACEVCGTFRTDPVEDEAYPIAFQNVSALRDRTDQGEVIGRAVTEDLDLRAAGVEDRFERDPATAPDVLRDVAAQERGEEDAGARYPTPARHPLPPPERLPGRDPTDEP